MQKTGEVSTRGALRQKGKGKAWGQVAVVGEKRIEFIASIAERRGITETMVCRMILNEAIDRMQAQ